MSTTARLIDEVERLDLAALRGELQEAGKRTVVLRHLIRAAESAQRLRATSRPRSRALKKTL